MSGRSIVYSRTMKQSTVKVERGSRGFGLSLVYRGLDHFAQVAIFKKYFC